MIPLAISREIATEENRFLSQARRPAQCRAPANSALELKPSLLALLKAKALQKRVVKIPVLLSAVVKDQDAEELVTLDEKELVIAIGH